MIQNFFDYIGSLFSVFFRWWAAALSVVLAVLGLLLAPEQGITLGRAGILLLSFVILFLFFLSFSVLVVSWRWFSESAMHPNVARIIPEQRDCTSLTFVVRSSGRAIGIGNCFAMFRTTKLDIEACVAILEVQSERTDQEGFQAIPRWMSPLHRRDFQSGVVKVEDLRLRSVSKPIISFVEERAREDRDV